MIGNVQRNLRAQAPESFMPSTFRIETRAGVLVGRESAGARKPTLLLLHGNSSSKAVFGRLMDGPLARAYRLIALDLPGHGDAQDARQPERDYTIPGYAAAALEALDALNARDAAIAGWSLGGHVALEMMACEPRLAGAFLISAPPAAPRPEALGDAYPVTAHTSLMFQERLNVQEQAEIVCACFGPRPPAFAPADLARTDGRARRILLESVLRGEGADPASLLEDPDRPLALVCGAVDNMVSTDYIAGARGAGLWRGEAQFLPNAGHAIVWDAPETVSGLLLAFLRDIARLARARAPAQRKSAAAPRAFALNAGTG